MDVPEDSRLFREARAGSGKAIGAVFERYGERLHALIRVRLGPQLRRRLESRDILQGTLLKAFQGIERFEGSGSASLMAWLGTIAQAEICDQADYYGRQKRDAARDTTFDERAEALTDPIRSVTSHLQLQEDTERLIEALDALSEEHREVIILRNYEELSFPEIGQRLGKSPDACRMLLARAMTALTLRMRSLCPR